MIRRILLLTGPSPVPSSRVIEIRRTPVLAGCQAQNSKGKGYTFQSCRVPPITWLIPRAPNYWARSTAPARGRDATHAQGASWKPLAGEPAERPS